MASRAQADAHRRDLLALTNLAGNDLRLLFRRFGTEATDARDALMDMLPQLVAVYGAAAATLAADWYDELRENASAKRRFRAIPAELPDTGRTDALARWAVGPLFAAEPDPATALTKTTGGLHRVITGVAAATVLASVSADPAGKGWQRSSAGGCDWCASQADGSVIPASVEMATHDFDKCVAAPVYG